MKEEFVVDRLERLNLTLILRKGWRTFKSLALVANKFDVLLHVLGVHRGTYCEYRLHNGLKFKVSNTKRDRTLLLSLHEIFREETYPLPYDKEIRTIIDLGANVGVFSLYAAMRYPQANIYAFEPDPDNFQQLQRNVYINGCGERVFPIQKAISGEGEKLTFFIDELTTRGSSLFRKTGKKISVVALNLPKLFKELEDKKCDVMKMDIEGAEYGVLYQCPGNVLHKIQLLLIEAHEGLDSVHPTYTRDKLSVYLEKLGYNVVDDNQNIITAKKTPGIIDLEPVSAKIQDH